MAMKTFSKIAAVIAVATLLHLLINLSGIIPFFDYRFFDVMARTQAKPEIRSAGSTVVVTIDEDSLAKLGQWPWPRIVLAKILREILTQHPAAVGFDIFFPEADRTSPTQLKDFYRDFLAADLKISGFPQGLGNHDLVFANALSAGPTVLPLLASQVSGPTRQTTATRPHLFRKLLRLPKGLKLPVCNHLLCNLPVLQRAADGFGFINASVDTDGILRRQHLVFRYRDRGLPNLGLAMLSEIDPDIEIRAPASAWEPLTIHFADKVIRTNHQGEFLNPFYHRDSFRLISAARLISGDVLPGFFTGKMVLIGASAAGLYDQFITASGEILPGVFAHASLIENFLRGDGFYQLEIFKIFFLLLSGLFSMVILVLVVNRSYLLSWGLYLSASAIAIAATWLALNHGCYISVGYFLTPFSLVFFLISMFFAVLHYVERKRFLEDLEGAHCATIDSMTMVAESRDVETGNHIIRTKEYVITLARALSQKGYFRWEITPHIIDLLYRAAPLHDIGKVGIPDEILRKPGLLSENEFKIMRTHVDIGRTIIENAINNYNKTNEFLTIAANITYTHHERWDGKGYPQGLKEHEIPLEGRIMALADVYDALINERYYKPPISFLDAEQLIARESGRHFDPIIVKTFLECRPKFRQIALRFREDGENTRIRFLE
ncbi:MAG: CHASE2 domain-containing protein [Deltaproteobacteria bacterium]|nr:CHASE2 domain-containing protein [Deltaproteobacteria bacterium]